MNHKKLHKIMAKSGVKIKDGKISKKDAQAIVNIVMAENSFETKLRDNKGAGAVVSKIALATKKGPRLDKYATIAEMVDSEWADNLANLQELRDGFGSKPEGLEALAEDLMDAVLHDMVSKKEWNRHDLISIAESLPLGFKKSYNIGR